jgi:hypothetical protein
MIDPYVFWFLIAGLAGLAFWSLWEQRCNDRDVAQELFELRARVRNLEQGKRQTLLPPPAPSQRQAEGERLLIPPPFPLPPLPDLPMQSKLTRMMTRVWRKG